MPGNKYYDLLNKPYANALDLINYINKGFEEEYKERVITLASNSNTMDQLQKLTKLYQNNTNNTQKIKKTISFINALKMRKSLESLQDSKELTIINTTTGFGVNACKTTKMHYTGK